MDICFDLCFLIHELLSASPQKVHGSNTVAQSDGQMLKDEISQLEAVVFCLVIAPRAYLLKKSVWLFHLIGDKAPHTARDRSEVAPV